MQSVQCQKSSKHSDRTLAAILSCCLAFLVLVVYWQVLDHKFLIWDDEAYVVDNPHVRSGISAENLLWAFTSTYESNWHPLTWVSHMMDCELYGLNPSGHHLTNLFLHLVNNLLLFWVLRRMTGALWQSAFAAALFSLHPLRMESVAWIAERKDVLSGLFWMTTLGAYLRYVRKPGGKNYLLVLFSFALGLMAKPMLVTLPLVLLLLDYWPLSRIRWGQSSTTPGNLSRQSGPSPGSVFLEKTPLLILAGASCLVTFLTAKGTGAVVPLEAFSLGSRLDNALLSYVKYLGMMLWPADLAFFYPPHLTEWSLWQTCGSLLLLGGLSLIVLRNAKPYPYLLVGWLWYLGVLVPVIGLVTVGSQEMADRYTYLPHIGLCIVLAWGTSDVFARFRRRSVLFSLFSGILILLLSLWTWSELPYWKNNASLFQRALRINPDNYLAHFLLGQLQFREGDAEGAIDRFSEALRFKPNYVPALVNLGSALRQQGKTELALRYLHQALKINPLPEAHHNLGLILAGQGQFREAIHQYEQALRIRPEDAKVHNDLAIALYHAGEHEKALSHLAEALKLNPGDPKVRHNLQRMEEQRGSNQLNPFAMFW